MTDYWAGSDPYCWPNSTILRNKLNIFEASKLQTVEGDAVRARADIGLPEGRFSLTHYRACHRWLFGDLYDWAGRYRAVRLAKAQSVFCFPEHIDGQMRAPFLSSKDQGNLAQTRRSDFVTRTAWF